MAGDWIKMRCNLVEDPRVFAMASRLNTTELHVVGMLFRVWSWADSQSIDGNGMSVTYVTLDRLVSCPGFCAELKKVGWLAGDEGALSFPNFAQHNGKTAKERALTKERVAVHRNAGTVTDVTPPPLPEKRREEKRSTEVVNPHAPAPSLQEWNDFATSIGWTGVDVASAFDYYEANGWKQNNGNKIRSWQAAARNCHRRNAGKPGAVQLEERFNQF